MQPSWYPNVLFHNFEKHLYLFRKKKNSFIEN